MKMNTLAILGLVLLLATASAAQTPGSFLYQGRLTDAAGTPLEGNIEVRFSIWSDPTAGAELWSDTITVATSQGVFSVELGPIPAAVTVFNGATRYLEIQVVGEAAMTPRQMLTAVPYAIRAGTAPGVTSVGTGTGLTGGTITGTGTISIANGGVGTTQLATNAVTGTKISNNTITALDVRDEPGVAQAIGVANLLVPLTGAGTSLLSVDINAPTDGFVMVTAEAMVFVKHTLGTWDNLIFKLSKTAGDISSGGTATGLVRIPETWPTSSVFYIQSISISQVFPVQAGTETFHLNGYDSKSTDDDSVLVPHLVAVFFPSSYGAVASASTNGGAAAAGLLLGE